VEVDRGVYVEERVGREEGRSIVEVEEREGIEVGRRSW